VRPPWPRPTRVRARVRARVRPLRFGPFRSKAFNTQHLMRRYAVVWAAALSPAPPRPAARPPPPTGAGPAPTRPAARPPAPPAARSALPPPAAPPTSSASSSRPPPAEAAAAAAGPSSKTCCPHRALARPLRACRLPPPGRPLGGIRAFSSHRWCAAGCEVAGVAPHNPHWGYPTMRLDLSGSRTYILTENPEWFKNFRTR
jgi:hypothetical protein